MKEQGTLVVGVQESLVELVGDSKVVEEAFGAVVYCRFVSVFGVPEVEVEAGVGVVVGRLLEVEQGRLVDCDLHQLVRNQVVEGMVAVVGAGVVVGVVVVEGMFGVFEVEVEVGAVGV